MDTLLGKGLRVLRLWRDPRKVGKYCRAERSRDRLVYVEGCSTNISLFFGRSQRFFGSGINGKLTMRT